MDLFELFGGGDASRSAVVRQSADSFSDIDPENRVLTTLSTGSEFVDPLVDYSDFANFITFNSAESYVTITADQILNEYPIGGTVDDLQRFLDALDGYQRYFLELWPSRTGHLRLNPADAVSYVRIDDFGVESGVTRTSFVSPGTGSLSVQGWIDVPPMTGSNDVLVVFQKARANDTYTVYTSGSQLFFAVSSGSLTSTVSGTISGRSFFAASLDRSSLTGTVSLLVGTTGSYPTLSDSSTIALGARWDLASGSFYIGSGSLSAKVVRPFTGSLDDVSVWSVARDAAALTGTYNRKVFAQPGLLACWRFNDALPTTDRSFASIVRDCSGHRLDGRIQNFFSGSLASGSLAFDSPDPILTLSDPDVVDYVIEARNSGTLYDRDNQSLIFNLVPAVYNQGDPTSVEVFRNFALILARLFDRIKVYIDQLANLRRVSYGSTDQAPDEFLTHIGDFLGWDLGGSFSTVDALQYFLGQSIVAGPVGNAGPAMQMNEIKAAFWRRTLLDLSYLYKTKGTRESVESLLRLHGANPGFVRLKEYARRAENRLVAARVVSEKSVYAMRFSGTASVRFVGP